MPSAATCFTTWSWINWLAVKNYLQNKEVSYNQLQLQCGICHEALDMPADLDQRDANKHARMAPVGGLLEA